MCRIARDSVWQGGTWQLTNETRYVCDGLLPIQELNSNNAVQVTYTRGPDLSGSFGGAGGIGGLLARTDGNGSAFYHADLSGNVTSLTDSGGNVVGRYLYDPFGGRLGKWGSLADRNVMQFSSMLRHNNSGLSLYASRAYDPVLQRWLTVDPMGALFDANQYRFNYNNPNAYVDPTGQNPILIGLGLWLLYENVAHSPGADDRRDLRPVQSGINPVAAGLYVVAPSAGLQADLQGAAAQDYEQQTGLPFPPIGGIIMPAGAFRCPPVVIREDMARVDAYAKEIGGYTITDWLQGRQWSRPLNDEFIAAMKAQQRDFVDIGPALARRLQNRINSILGRGPSSDYGRERRQLSSYGNCKRAYQRTGKYEGGVPGFDD